MNKEKYVIVDLHPADSFYEQKEKLIGQVISFPDGIDNNYKYSILDVPNGEGFTAGKIEFDVPVELVVVQGSEPEICETLFLFAVRVVQLS